MAGLFKKLWHGCLWALAGPLVDQRHIEPNPLMRKDPQTNERTRIPKKDVVARAEHLISCNLEDSESHLMLAAALVTSKKSWEDENLRKDTRNKKTSSDKKIEESSSAQEEIEHRAMTDEEYESFKQDQGNIIHRLYRQPWAMWQLMLLCGLGAMIQGWDEAAVNGAQVFYQRAYDFGPNDKRIGFINGAPYACCILSCWVSWPLNGLWGRRGTIFFAALCSFAFALGQSFANDWVTMLILRIFLGLGIGPKSATIPIYASEIAPANIRGALVMLWQLFTALGIMFGYLAGVAFASSGQGDAVLRERPPCFDNDSLLSLPCSLNWRLMIGSPMVAPILLCLYIFMQPESPRWLITRAQRKERFNNHILAIKNQQLNAGRANLEHTSDERSNRRQSNYQQPLGQQIFEKQSRLKRIDLEPVFLSLVRLRGGSKLKAARDMLTIDVLLWDQNLNHKQNGQVDSGTYDLDTTLGQSQVVTGGRSSGHINNSNIVIKRNLKKRARNQIVRAGRQLKALFKERRNFNALLASTVVMFLQQFCGINVLIYYSTLVLFQTADSDATTLWGSVPKFVALSSVVGIMNFLFGLPALFVIDQRGRRPLLLRTFPCLCLSALLVAIGNVDALKDSAARPGLIFSGMVLFVVFYSPGEGPVPFVYASESFPQDIRDLGMAVVTSLNWAFNFTVAVTYPDMANSWGLAWTFGFYSFWCFIGFFLVLFFVSETCQKELEKLDDVFDEELSVIAKEHAISFWKAASEDVPNSFRSIWGVVYNDLPNTVHKVTRRRNITRPRSRSIESRGSRGTTTPDDHHSPKDDGYRMADFAHVSDSRDPSPIRYATSSESAR